MFLTIFHNYGLFYDVTGASTDCQQAIIKLFHQTINKYLCRLIVCDVTGSSVTSLAGQQAINRATDAIDVHGCKTPTA